MKKTILLSLIILLTACQAPEPVETATTTPESTTAVPSPSPSATVTQSPMPTVNLTGTALIEIELTKIALSATPTVRLTLTASPTPTPGVKELYTDPSPYSDEWEAAVFQTYVEGQTRRFLTVRRLDGTVEWIVNDVEYEDKIMTRSLDPDPFFWSTDGKYFYFTHRLAGDGCWPSFIHGFQQVDLKTGEVKTLIKESVLRVVFSPNERYLAYFLDGSLHIIDLEIEIEASLEYESTSECDYLVNSILWSPDGGSLLFNATYQVCVRDEPVTIVHVDLENMSQTVLIENDSRHDLHLVRWLENDTVLLTTFLNGSWHLNPWTGELTEAPSD